MDEEDIESMTQEEKFEFLQELYRQEIEAEQLNDFNFYKDSDE
jgi:hypothetical protein